MVKVKYKIWIGLLILSIILKFAIATVPSFLDGLFEGKQSVDVYVSSKEDTKIKNQITGMRNDKLVINIATSVNDKTQAIITDKLSDELNISAYDKYPNAFTSPIVLFAPNDALEKSENFSAGTGNEYSLSKDFYEILIAMESNKTWTDIGISKNVASGKVSLLIPAKNTPYYPAVVEAIYMTLNQNKDVLTVEDISLLKNRVDKILDKCVKSEDVGKYITRKAEDNNKDLNSLVLGPEFIISDNTDAYSRSNDGDWMPIYLRKTSNISLDLYLKKNNPYMESLKSIFSNASFAKATGMRTTNRDYTLSSRLYGFDSAIEIVEIGQTESGVRDKIKNDLLINTISQETVPETVPAPISTTSTNTTTPVEKPATKPVTKPVAESKPASTEKKQTQEKATSTEEDSTSFGDILFFVVVGIFCLLLLVLLVSTF